MRMSMTLSSIDIKVIRAVFVLYIFFYDEMF